jgi:drug/metabolite transporter (DMT)-like permease
VAPSAQPAKASTSAIIVALLIVYLFWGSAWVALKLTMMTVPPFVMLTLRWFIAGALLFGWALFTVPRGERELGWRQWLSALYVGGSIIGIANSSYVFSLQFLPSGITAILAAAMPVFTAVIAFLVTRKPLALSAIFGLLIAIGGIVFLVQPSGQTHIPIMPALIMLGANIVWALAVVYMPRLPLPRHTTLSSGMQLLCGALGPLALSLFTGEFSARAFSHMTPASFGWVLWLALFAGVLPFVAYTWLLENTRPTIASTFAYVNPVVALLLGAVILHEALTVHVLIGSAIILTGVILIVFAHAHTAAPPHAPAAHPAGVTPPSAQTLGNCSSRRDS